MSTIDVLELIQWNRHFGEADRLQGKGSNSEEAIFWKHAGCSYILHAHTDFNMTANMSKCSDVRERAIEPLQKKKRTAVMLLVTAFGIFKDSLSIHLSCDFGDFLLCCAKQRQRY